MRRAHLVLAVGFVLPLALGACGSSAPPPHKEAINPDGGPVTTPYSPIVRSGSFLFLSGVIGRGDDIGGATRQALEGIRDRLAAVDAGMEDVVKCTVFLVDMADYQGLNEAYSAFFPSDPPARTTIAVQALPANARVEIACIAAAG